MIDAYFRFEKVPNLKSKYLLAKNVGDYEPLQALSKSGECSVYLTDSSYLQSRRTRQANFALSSPTMHHISGVFIPDPSKPTFAFGDYKKDALLFILGEGVLEILVFQGQSKAVKTLSTMLGDGEFEADLKRFRESKLAS